MAIEWIALAAGAAVKAVVGTTLSGVAGQARKRIDKILSDGPLEAPLRKAFTQAFTGFYKSLDAGLVFTISNEEALAKLPESDAFRDVVGQLPYRPFRQIDPEALCREFLAIGIEGADDATFGAAWQALGKRFERAVAESGPLKSFVDLSSSARQEEREEKLLALVERLAEAQEKATQSADPEPAIRRYREAVLLEYQYADTRGLFMREKEGVGEEISLREVFVETSLARIQQEASKDRGEDGEELELGRPYQRPADKEETLSIRDLLARERLVVILGPPGCGKSTLLRCLALTLCQSGEEPPILEHALAPGTIPLLLPLKRYASGLRKEPNLSLSDYFFDLFERDLPNLHDILTSGGGLVLFDGLDEVFDEAHRGWVSEEVWRFAARFPRSRLILTSRPRGYEAAPLPGPIPLSRLLPFDDEQIGQFFHGWFKALARVRGEVGDGEVPETRAASLTQDVLSRDRLKEMAQNPLLCTLIVLVHRSRSGGRLPERRVVFLEAAVKTLAEAWERLKRSPQQAELDFPEPEILIRALAEVAWRAFHPEPSREIAGDDLRRWLEEYLEREPDWKGGKGRRAVRDFLKLVGERTGLLVDLGGDRYQFVHLSLHEWLVSYFLLDRLNESERLTVFRYYLHAPEWDEILRLLVGGAPRAQADLLAAKILDDPTSSWERALYRDLRFLLLCAGDQAPIGPDVRERLGWQGLAALKDPELLDDSSLLRDLARLGQVPALKAEFLAKLGDEDGSVRMLALSYFASVGAMDEETRRAVLTKLGDEAAYVRSSAVDCFAQIGAADEETRRAVLAKLGDEAAYVRSSAVDYFAQIGAADKETRRAVLAKLGDEEDYVRSSAMSYFSRIGAVDKETRRAVLAKLDDDDSHNRSSVLSYLARIGATDEETRRAVLAKLDDEDWSIRGFALLYFSQVGAVDEETHRAVLAKLDDEDSRVRSLALSYLTRIGAVDEETRRAVLAKLGDEKREVRFAVISYFAQVGAVDEETRRAFLSDLDDEQREVRYLAMSYLTQVGAADEEMRRAFLAKFDDEDENVRRMAVSYFAQVGAVDEETRRAVLGKLGDEDGHVRKMAMSYCAQVGAVDEETRRAVLAKLDDEDEDVRKSALQYFVSTGFKENLLEQLWASYVRTASYTFGEVDRIMAERIGAYIAENKTLQDRILSEGREISYFYTLLVRALALEQDRLHRHANPLRLTNIPNCS